MAAKKVFISYSRKQFYFVEHLATLLKTQYGLEAWFDIHELTIGTDWATSIQRALETCDALVLVASQASLQSKYVQQEYQTALKANKPVLVAFFEPVDLPSELANVPIIDLRGNFDRDVGRLVKALDTPGKPVDSPPKSGLLHKRFPMPVWVVVLAYLSPVTLLGGIGLWAVPLIVVGLLLLRSFLNRSYRVSEHRSTFLLAAVLAGAAAFIVFINNNNPDVNVPQFPALIGSLGTVAVLSIIAWWMLGNSAALLRWAPTGQGNQRVRERVNKAIQSRTKLQITDLSRTYSLYYDRADERVAADVRQAMNAAFYREVLPNEANPDHDIIITSNRTPLELIRKLTDPDASYITVVSTAFALPLADKEVSKYQWIDYRKRDKEALQNMVEDIYLRDSGQPNTTYAFMPVPESFSNILPPPKVEAIAQTLNLIGGFSILTVLSAFFVVMPLLMPTTPRRVAYYGQPYIFNPWDSALLTLAGFTLLWLAQQIRAREISFIPAAIIGLVALPASIYFATRLGELSGDFSTVVQCVTLLGLVAIFSGLAALNRWLLPIGSGRRTRESLEVQPKQRLPIWLILAALMIVMLGFSFVMPRLIGA